MTLHPKERPDDFTRRDFLLRTAGAATLVSGAGGILAACASETTAEGTTGKSGEPLGPGGLPLARPDKRVTMPLWEDPIASGLEPETGGTFTVFNYPDYLYKKLLKDFGKKYERRRPVHGLRQHLLRDPAPRFRCRHAGRDGDDARQPRPARWPAS